MVEIDFSLSQKNLKDFPFHKYPKNFTFIVNGKKYLTTRIIADIMSPTIRKLHFTDESMNEFNINIENFQVNDTECLDYFDKFLNLCSFETLKIDSNVQSIYSTYFYQLGNYEEFFRINPKLFSDLSVKNVFDRLQLIFDIFKKIPSENQVHLQYLDEIILFISNHFEEIDKERLKNVPIEIIEGVFKNIELKVEDEDSLLEFVLKLYKVDRSYSILFEYIEFCNVSEKSLEMFIDEFDINYLNYKIWSKICSCLRKTNNKRSFDVFNFTEGKEFDGIMNHLTIETGGNIHNNKTIEITSSPTGSSGFEPQNVVDYNKNNLYCSKDYLKESFICFNFKDKKVQLSEYSIKSPISTYNGFLKNWVIEVSNDGENFIEIDRRSDNSQLNGFGKYATFAVQNKNSQFYQFVRLRTTGESWHDSYCYKIKNLIHSIEFFGKLQEQKK